MRGRSSITRCRHRSARVNPIIFVRLAPDVARKGRGGIWKSWHLPCNTVERVSMSKLDYQPSLQRWRNSVDLCASLGRVPSPIRAFGRSLLRTEGWVSTLTIQQVISYHRWFDRTPRRNYCQVEIISGWLSRLPALVNLQRASWKRLFNIFRSLSWFIFSFIFILFVLVSLQIQFLIFRL